jgi:TolB-like protein
MEQAFDLLRMVAAVALLAALGAAGWFYGRSGRSGETIDSLAVLPFVNSSGDPNTEYLSDGITESLINSLSQLPNLKVMSRDSTFRYKGKEKDAQTVGRELGVRAIFTGRITQRGDTLNISAELINARDSRRSNSDFSLSFLGDFAPALFTTRLGLDLNL